MRVHLPTPWRPNIAALFMPRTLTRERLNSFRSEKRSAACTQDECVVTSPRVIVGAFAVRGEIESVELALGIDAQPGERAQDAHEHERHAG
jgi:hypothetical protein